MAEYHYKYDRPSSPPPGGGYNNDRNNNTGGGDILGWIIAVGMLMVFPPVGIFLLITQLAKSADASRRRTASRYTRYTYSTPAQTDTVTAAQAKKAPPAKSKRAAKPGAALTVAGGILTGVFGFSFLMSLVDALSWGGLVSELPSLAATGSLAAGGLACLYLGFKKRSRAKLFKKYQALIGKRTEVSISTLAKAAGRSYRKVCDDLQDMLDDGILPTGYLDLSSDRLVLTDQGIADEPVQVREEPREEPQGDAAILAEIRAVNDAIPDPTMSAKIDRIQEITGKILEYQRLYPEKSGQVRSFLNYYLPTTLKVLRSYAQLVQQGIEGQNITAAKQRIEGMMDKVVEGFETQLDKLFQNTAMDITSDVAVLEKMLDNDGLSQGGGMTLGI